MDYLDRVKELSRPNENKILLFVMDGLGGLPVKELDGKTELEAARTPNMNKLARASALGVHDPIATGFTPGSGPAHLGLFGYDPIEWNIGRGVLETLGVDFDLKEGDVAVRTNFCTLDKNGNITDRRAGRISTDECARLSEKLDKAVNVQGVETIFMPVRDYRGGIVLRGKGLGHKVDDTDPQVTGKKPLPAKGGDAPSKKTAKILNEIVKQARKVLKDESRANGLLLRGISTYRRYPDFGEIYNLRAACIAGYPMYRGVSKLVGMKLIGHPENLDEEIKLLEKSWKDFDFFFVHYKYTDSRGEDGDHKAKVKEIEKADKVIPRMLKLKPEVMLVTGDHSTPTQLKSHSWHPVPFMLHARHLRHEPGNKFGETACASGSLGRIPAVNLLPLAMAHAGKLLKYGA